MAESLTVATWTRNVRGVVAHSNPTSATEPRSMSEPTDDLPFDREAPQAPRFTDREAPQAPRLSDREAPQAPRLSDREAPQAPRFTDREAPQAPRFTDREAPQAPRFIDEQELAMHLARAGELLRGDRL